MDTPMEQAELVKERAAADLLGRVGVVGVGVTLKGGQAAIQILVGRLTPDVADRLPERIEGLPVVVEEVGEIRTR